MRARCFMLILCILVCVACGKSPKSDSADPQPIPAAPHRAAPAPAASLQRAPIDLGDVDSGISISGRLAPLVPASGIREETVETKRGKLAMCTIHVSPPFRDELAVRFEVTASRAFAERPVVLRVRVFRDETPVTEEFSFVLGRDANLPPVDSSGMPSPRAFVVNALSGLDAPPASLLLHARATAWLMEAGTPEELLNPSTASSDERVAIMSNPVRIHFEQAGGDAS